MNVAGDQRSVCARDIAKRFLNRFLMFLILKGSYPITLTFKNICERLLRVILFRIYGKDTANTMRD